jgi:hypothetical protein
MRKLLTSLVVLGTLGIAGTSHAANGTVTMGWDACNLSPITDKVVTAQQLTTANLVGFVSGQSDSVLAYVYRFLYGDASHQVPDAWRFDASGCETGAFVTLNGLPPAALSKACPPLQNIGGGQSSVIITDLNFYPPAGTQYDHTLMFVQIANAFQHSVLPLAASKYFVGDAEFNLSAAVVGAGDPGNTCGGLETEICFNLAQADWVASDGLTQNSWNFHGGASGDFATAGTAPFAGSCQGTPAQTKTWGQIKNQYRN